MIVEAIFTTLGASSVYFFGSAWRLARRATLERGADIETIVVKIAAPPPSTAAIEAHEAHLAAGSPFAFWLDYARKAVVPAKPKPAERPWPNCPSCGADDYRQVLTQHKGEATSWHCTKCGEDFTRGGAKPVLTNAQKKRRREMRQLNDQRADAAATRDRRLPCGCSGHGRQYPAAFGVDRHTECLKCGAWWYSRSNDPTGQTLAKGKQVYHPYREVSRQRHAEMRHGLNAPTIETQEHIAGVVNALNTLDGIDYENDLPPPPHHD